MDHSKPWLAILFLVSVLRLVSTIDAATTTVNATNPLVYTRLRHDHNYLQLYRRYQLKNLYEERQFHLKVNETLPGNKTRTAVYSYYENPKIEATSVTQDDLILEALDRTYKSRLVPSYIYNYDNEADRNKSSDPSLVSPTRCNRELNYLLEKLADLKRPSHGQKAADPLSPELLAFFDSYAGEEPGLLLGNYHWTGSWRQCNKRFIFDLDRSNLSNTMLFSGRYCIASIRSRTWEPKIKAKVDELLVEGNYFKYPEQKYDYARFFRIQVGICLPQSCDSQTIYTRRNDIRTLVMHKLNEPFKSSYELVDLFCLPDETSEFRKLTLSGWLFVLASVCWCSSIVTATIYDWYKPSGKVKGKKKSVFDKLVSALSLIKNYRRLIETDSLRPPRQPPVSHNNNNETSQTSIQSRLETSRQHQPHQAEVQLSPTCGEPQRPTTATQQQPKLVPKDLLFLNSIKVVSMPMIIYGHAGMMLQHFSRWPLDYESYDSEISFHFHASSVTLVDWYFAITGFLTTYTMFVTNKVERNTPLQWAYSIFHRYWRLAPVYIVLFWFMRSIFQYVSVGPVWDYGASNMTTRAICQRESWLWPLTLTQNLHPLHEECVVPSWYIANDMQFYLITPFILIALSKAPLAGWIMVLGLIASNIALRINRFLTDPRAQPLELMRPRLDLYMRNNWDLHATYIYPHYRVAPYLIGVLVGHYVYMVLSGKWTSIIYQPPRPNNNGQHTKPPGLYSPEIGTKNGQGRYKLILRKLAWFVGLYICTSMLFVTLAMSELFPRLLEPYVKYFTAVFYGFGNAIVGLGMALIFVTLMFGQYPKIKQIMSHPYWTLITRVNYFVFLVQVELCYWLLHTGERSTDFSQRESNKVWFLLTCLCYVISPIIALWLELPLAHLEREFIGALMTGKSSRKQPIGGGQRRSDHGQEHCALHNASEQQHQHQQQRNGAVASATC